MTIQDNAVPPKHVSENILISFVKLTWMLVVGLHLIAVIGYYDQYTDFLAEALSADGELLAPLATTVRLTIGLLLIGFVFPMLKIFFNRMKAGSFLLLFLTFYMIMIIHLVLRFTILGDHPSEDHWLQLSQAGVIFISGAILIFLSIFTMRNNVYKGSWNGGLLYGLYGLLLLLIVLEEVNWGQSAFGWKVPEYFYAISSVGETNLHSLIGPYIPEIWVIAFATVLAFLALSEQIARFLKRFMPLSEMHPVIILPKVRQVLLLDFAIILLIVLGEGELAEEIFALVNLFVAITLVVLTAQAKRAQKDALARRFAYL
ncbi:MAG: hypothetical protein AAF423_08835 [Pseudomonadota bacterium]